MLLHIDTDIGGDTDDLCALAMVLGWPDAEVVAVTTVAEEAGRRAGYARYALDLAGRSDIPVFAGADVALGRYREPPTYPDEARYWPQPITPRPAPHDLALAALARSIEAGATVVAIGPFTNLALLERRSPGILRSANLVLMGGSVFPIRAGYPAWGNEWDYNIQVDVESAQAVLEASHPTLVPLTVTLETALREADLPALHRGGPLARLLARQAEAFAADERMAERLGRTHIGLPDDLVNFQHDALACAVALGWGGVELRDVRLRYDIEGGFLHEREAADGVPVRLVTAVDAAAFAQVWLRAIVP